MNSTLVEDDIAVAVIDALTSQICVVDPEGNAVNRAWRQFTADNSSGQVHDHIGVNYLNICRHSVGPASEETTMKLSEKYRIKALACEKLGREVPNRDFKSAWEEIAIEWHALANRAAQDAGNNVELANTWRYASAAERGR